MCEEELGPTCRGARRGERLFFSSVVAAATTATATAICFTTERESRQPERVRAFAASPFFLSVVLSLLILPRMNAQEQENKLVDRLLRPDMTLQNNAQKKKFVAAGAPLDRHATVREFYWQEKTNTKKFANTREFSSQQYNSRSFRGTKDSANLNTKTIHKSDLAFKTQTATGVRAAGSRRHRRRRNPIGPCVASSASNTSWARAVTTPACCARR